METSQRHVIGKGAGGAKGEFSLGKVRHQFLPFSLTFILLLGEAGKLKFVIDKSRGT